ncbi:MAG: ROK family transcriptional regulator [Ancalomicrobiaceae bacterium]|nr:ROK family transcriptional regulator [Ancalomicrobiaceae bacterium]
MNGSRGRSGGARLQPGDLGRGTNQTGVRLYNERLVLSLIRRHGSLPKADLAKLTGLSAQTASVIVNQLVGDGLIRREEPQRGKVGQPSVPYSLNPDGVSAFGLKVGRRSADLVLLDFVGRVRQRLHLTYHYPLPHVLVDFAASGVRRFEAGLSVGQLARVGGFGLAMPFEMWNWEAEVGCPPGALDVWRHTDLARSIGDAIGRPVQLCNDATAACAAELVFGRREPLADFLYLFIGSFVGGGLVLNSTLVQGRTGNAAALGSLPVTGPSGSVQQLIRTASLYTLEARLIGGGKPADWLWEDPDCWDAAGPELDDWIAEAAAGLAYAATAASAVVELQAVVIDGAVPAAVRTRLVDAVQANMARYDRQGLSPIDVLAGTIGSAAREIGAASLPLLASFAFDRDVMFKEST